MKFREAKLPDDIEFVRQLWTDYLTWGNDSMQELYVVHPHNPEEAVKEDVNMIDKFLPPNGRLMLAFIDKSACGIGCLKSISKEIGEIKRMYVNPSFRKIGVGRAILQSFRPCWCSAVVGLSEPSERDQQLTLTNHTHHHPIPPPLRHHAPHSASRVGNIIYIAWDEMYVHMKDCLAGRLAYI